jgi:cell division control protein 42
MISPQSQLLITLIQAKEGYASLRPLSYSYTDVPHICSKVTRPDSPTKVESHWIPEMMHHVAGVPYLLVGMQIDLRTSQSAHTHPARIAFYRQFL